MKGLQKLNLIESMKRMAPTPGWEVLEGAGFTAIQSPARRPLGNIAWGEPNYANIARGLTFFRGRPHSWLLEQGQDASALVQSGFRRIDPAPEMVFNLVSGPVAEARSGIRVGLAESPDELRAWVEIVGEGFNMTGDEAAEFFLPLAEGGSHLPYLAWYEGEPAATAMVFPGRTCAGIYAVSTREKFRRMGNFFTEG